MIKNVAEEQLTHILMDLTHDKVSRDVAINELRKTMVSAFEDPTESRMLNSAWSSVVKSTMCRLALKDNLRVDGRRLDEFRPIKIDVDVYKKLHGMFLFLKSVIKQYPENKEVTKISL